MLDELADLYQEVILDHSRRPRNCHPLPAANRTARGQNPLCGDQVTLFLRLEGDRIAEISFQGSGCAISKASASLLTDSLKGKTTTEARDMFQQMHRLVTTGQADAQAPSRLAPFAGVHRFPGRVKCAILAWHAALAALEGQGAPVSTE